jgi:hypothetical protein
MDEFIDGDTIHFILGPNGELFIIDAKTQEEIDRLSPKVTATIDRIDRETNTIWFK